MFPCKLVRVVKADLLQVLPLRVVRVVKVALLRVFLLRVVRVAKVVRAVLLREDLLRAVVPKVVLRVDLLKVLLRVLIFLSRALLSSPQRRHILVHRKAFWLNRLQLNQTDPSPFQPTLAEDSRPFRQSSRLDQSLQTRQHPLVLASPIIAWFLM